MKLVGWLSGVGVCLGLVACSTPTRPVALPMVSLRPLPSATPRLMVTPPLETPVVLASPTPSPTPVIYVVKKGDTLGGIALAFGVSVEALQALNGDVQPAYLSVGRALTIPVTAAGAPAPLVPLGPAFTPYPVMLSVPACYPQATGALYCLLEAHNPGQTALENISARVLLVDGQGGVVQETEAVLAVKVLPPGGAAPLAALFPAVPEGWAGAVGRLSSAMPAVGQFAPLEVVAPTGQALAGQWTVTGQVRNGTALAVQAAWVVLTVYDPAGQLVGYRKATVTGPVPAGGSVAFAVSAAVLGGTGERYQVIAEGQP